MTSGVGGEVALPTSWRGMSGCPCHYRCHLGWGPRKATWLQIRERRSARGGGARARARDIIAFLLSQAKGELITNKMKVDTIRGMSRESGGGAVLRGWLRPVGGGSWSALLDRG